MTITGPGTTEIAWATPDPIVYGHAPRFRRARRDRHDPRSDGHHHLRPRRRRDERCGRAAPRGCRADDHRQVRARPDAAARFLPSSRTVTIDVAQSTQVIDLGALRDRTYGDPSVPLSPTGGAFASTGPWRPRPEPATLRRHGATAGRRHCTLSATQEGNADYLPAPSITRSFAIAKAPLVVTAPSIKRRIGATTALVPTYSGFVNGDGVGDLLEPATCVTEALATSPAGTYRVTCPRVAAKEVVVHHESPQTSRGARRRTRSHTMRPRWSPRPDASPSRRCSPRRRPRRWRLGDIPLGVVEAEQHTEDFLYSTVSGVLTYLAWFLVVVERLLQGTEPDDLSAGHPNGPQQPPVEAVHRPALALARQYRLRVP